MILSLPKCHFLVDVGDHGTLLLLILLQLHQSGYRKLSRDSLHSDRYKIQSLPASLSLSFNSSKEHFFSVVVPKTSTASFLHPPATLFSPTPSLSLFHLSTLPSTVLSASFSKTTCLLHPVSSSVCDPGSRSCIRRRRTTR